MLHPRPPRPCSAARRPPSVRRRRACRLWRSCRSGRLRPREGLADQAELLLHRPHQQVLDHGASTREPPGRTCLLGRTAIAAAAPALQVVERSARRDPLAPEVSHIEGDPASPRRAGRSRRRSTDRSTGRRGRRARAGDEASASAATRTDLPSPCGSPSRSWRTTGQCPRSFRKPVAFRPLRTPVQAIEGKRASRQSPVKDRS